MLPASPYIVGSKMEMTGALNIHAEAVNGVDGIRAG